MRIARPLGFVAMAMVLACAACSQPEPPEKERPPEPQAQPAPEQATQLRDSIQRPIDRAKAVEGQVQDAAAKQQAAIDAQTGG